jgi:YidC/Oxa1 family membrane protein insertase
MDNTRLFLFIALSFIGLMVWDAWQRDYVIPPTETISANPATSNANDATPTITEPSKFGNQTGVDDGPKVQDPTNLNTAAGLNDNNVGFVSVKTDLFNININLRGGGISHAALNQYPIESSNPDIPFEFLTDSKERFFIHQNGITGDGQTPDHKAVFNSAQSNYVLADGNDKLEVTLNWDNSDGLTTKKTYLFTRDSYVIEINYAISNNGANPWQGRLYEQLQRAKPSSNRRLLYTFTGAALSTPEKRYEKYDYDDLKDNPINLDVTDGWVSILEHYFVTAILPERDQSYHYYSKTLDESRYLVGLYSQPQSVAPGGIGSFKSRLYIGPKRQDILVELAPSLDKTVDFGVLWFIGEPLFKSLSFIHDLLGNWGWAIIILTIILKLIFYPLSAAGYRSMAKMRKVQPRMVSIKERYDGDRSRMNQAMMELYKEEKINPLGGCLPIIVQIPVFIALYWVLLESVELRQVPFALWLTDLTAKDPYFVLPLLMGISMWIQQKLNPAPMDPIQQKVMQILPFVFTIFFAFFPAGLVLYWVVNNVLSILQQWRITKVIEQGK